MQARPFYRLDSIGDGSVLIWSTPHCPLEYSGIRGSTNINILVLLCMYTLSISIISHACEQATKLSGQKPASYPLHCLGQRSTIAGHWELNIGPGIGKCSGIATHLVWIFALFGEWKLSLAHYLVRGDIWSRHVRLGDDRDPITTHLNDLFRQLSTCVHFLWIFYALSEDFRLKTYCKFWPGRWL